MQEPGAGAGGSLGGGGGGEEEGERSGQNIPLAGEEQRSSGSSSGDEGRHDDDARHVVREPRGPQDPGNVAGAGNPVEGAPVQPGLVDEEAAGEPQGEQPPIPSGPGGDAAMGIASRLMEFCVMVHFQSPLEAHMARRTLMLNARRQEARVQQEFRVINSAMAAWMSEDIFLFRTSINHFLDQLALVMRTIQRLELAATAQRARGRARARGRGRGQGRGRGIRRPES